MLRLSPLVGHSSRQCPRGLACSGPRRHQLLFTLQFAEDLHLCLDTKSCNDKDSSSDTDLPPPYLRVGAFDTPHLTLSRSRLDLQESLVLLKVNAAPTALIRGAGFAPVRPAPPTSRDRKDTDSRAGRGTGHNKQAVLSGADPGPAHLESEVFLHCAPWASRLLRLGPSPALSR